MRVGEREFRDILVVFRRKESWLIYNEQLKISARERRIELQNNVFFFETELLLC